MALVGNLKDLKLPSLIQLNCMERNTAKLTIEHSGKYGFIYFDAGQVVHAEYEPDIGEQAVSKLLALYSGNFKVESGIRAPVKSIQKHWNNLLLDALHQIDNNDDNQDHKFDHLFERLFTVRGVQNITIFDKTGTIIASSQQEVSKDAALFAFVRLQNEKIGDALGTTLPEFTSVAAASKKYIFTQYNKLDVAIEMEHKIKLDVVLPLMKQALS